MESVRAAVPASLAGMIGYFVLFPAMYYSSYFGNVFFTIAVSFVSWFIVVLIIILTLGKYNIGEF